MEPAIDRSRLRAAAGDAYAIAVRDLSFMPVGLGAACYELVTGDGARYVLKVWPHLRSGGPAAERQQATLALTRAVHDQGIGVRVPYPLRTRTGALWATIDEMPFALAPLLPGWEPPAPWPPSLAAELGRTLATLHRATPSFAGLVPRGDPLAVAWEPALLRNLDAAPRIGPEARPGLRAVRRFVLEQQDDIRAQLARLHRLQAAARRCAGPLVLCHTDLHGGNLLVDDEGRVSLLDWDDAKMAPPEHDLWSGLGPAEQGESFVEFLAAYRDAGGAFPLHIERFAFYLLRRYIEDMAVNLDQVLAPDADEREDAAQLYGMEAWGAPRWSRLDETLSVIAAGLRQIERP